ncbi:MAG: ABC transporter ATP-binding protein, partial [Acidaminococcaceae bacterium]|nr:ABC transporter ATP-binding protein [Acidaminococcaceae bacterium]
MTDLIAVKNGEIAAQGHCEDVVPHIYEDKELRPLLPDLWQIKCNLEKGTAQKFSLWRSADEAVKELQSKGFERGVRA